MARRDELHEDLLAAKIALEGWLSAGERRVEARDVFHHALLTAFSEQWPEQVPSWLPRVVASTVGIRTREPLAFSKERRAAVAYLAQHFAEEETRSART